MLENLTETELNENKKGLLLTLLQRKFEDSIYERLEHTDFSDLNKLDSWLTEEMKKYFQTCEIVMDYYNRKIDS